MVAFTERRTWSQADLARATGVAARTVRTVMEDLVEAGWPFVRDEDHPHVYWSAPKDWFPGGLVLDAKGIAALVHVLVRSPAGDERDKLLEAVKRHTPATLSNALDRIMPPVASPAEGKLLPAMLDAVAREIPVRVRYYSSSRGTLSNRTLSVQRVMAGAPARVVAWCHTANALRWFRLDSVAHLTLDETEPFHAADDAEVNAMLASSVDGYQGKARVRVAFLVRDPEARWVAQNLPEGLIGIPEESGLFVEAETAGLLPIARFVVGLGDAAECHSPELARLVAELARGAIKGAEAGE